MAILEIKDLHAAVEGQEILKGIDLELDLGEMHAVMGPNGSGKSTLAKTLMGHPAYEVTAGEVTFDGEDLLAMEVDERARRGLFLAFQYPQEIPGVSMVNFLRTALNARQGIKKDDMNAQLATVQGFTEKLEQRMEQVGLEYERFAGRYLNEGFSGGEKKKNEILQVAMLEPKVVILDEIDSGLDIDALRYVASVMNDLKGSSMGSLVITHYQRILDYIEPDHVHVVIDGRVATSGGPELAHELEAKGYEWLHEEVGA